MIVRTPNRRRLLLLFVLPVVTLAQDAPRLPPPADQDQFVGTWQANGDKSRPKLNQIERSYSRTIARSGEDLVFSSVGGPSKARIRQFRVRCDGHSYRLPTGPRLSCRYTAADRVEGETLDPNQTWSYWMREVSLDGQQMTITEYKDKARTRIRSVMVLDRVR